MSEISNFIEDAVNGNLSFNHQQMAMKQLENIVSYSYDNRNNIKELFAIIFDNQKQNQNQNQGEPRRLLASILVKNIIAKLWKIDNNKIDADNAVVAEEKEIVREIFR
jgi:hypothetical protein